VPTCPDWDVAALVHHVGGFTGFWTHVLAEGTGREKPSYDEPPLADGPAAVAGWWRGVGDSLIAELRAASPETQVWTWAPSDETAAFVATRCTHELAVHALDAQIARDNPQPIDAAVAADGIEEIFVMMEAWRANGQHQRGIFEGGSGETLHIHGTDEGRSDEWLVTMNADGFTIDRTHSKGDLALRGAVSDLELVLYDRQPLGPVERFGDESVLDLWRTKFFHFG
jgi:uncharacterized protein (TIGR03083 family)